MAIWFYCWNCTPLAHHLPSLKDLERGVERGVHITIQPSNHKTIILMSNINKKTQNPDKSGQSITSINNYLSLIKFQHIVFSFPFAVIGFISGLFYSDTTFSIKLIILIVLCVVFARNAAMSFNRWADRKYDEKNPRTSDREIPAKRISSENTLIFSIVNAIFFIVTTVFINKVCFYLSFVAIFIIFFYSLFKRFSSFSHFVLGLSLAIAPVGGYIAITGVITLPIMILALVVCLWVSGFDILYAVQDYDFDKREKLFSIPVRYGIKKSYVISAFLHFLCLILFLIWIFLEKNTGFFSLTGFGLFMLSIVLQHAIVYFNNPKYLKYILLINGVGILLFCFFYILDII